MAGGEPRLGTTATYMRHNDHGTTRPSTEIDRLNDRTDNEYRIFSAGSVRKWSKFGLDRIAERESGWRFAGRSLDRKSFSYERTILRCSCFEIAAARRVAGVDCGERER